MMKVAAMMYMVMCVYLSGWGGGVESTCVLIMQRRQKGKDCFVMKLGYSISYLKHKQRIKTVMYQE
jgi:CRISPR/Cas system CSM-associated protein Csm5 (group 7 of RAMP superfamily)